MNAAVEALATAYGEAWNGHDVEAITALHTDDMAMEAAATGDIFAGDDLRAFLESYFKTWPDISFESRRVFITSELIVNEWTATATHSQPVPRGERSSTPDGSTITWTGIDVLPVRDGKIERKIVYANSLGLFDQLGLL